jgi:predicted small lipoprotein YifL
MNALAVVIVANLGVLGFSSMLRDFDVPIRASRRARIAVVLAVAWVAVAAAGCGIKGPLRPVTPPGTTPPATDMGPPLPPAEPELSTTPKS